MWILARAMRDTARRTLVASGRRVGASGMAWHWHGAESEFDLRVVACLWGGCGFETSKAGICCRAACTSVVAQPQYGRWHANEGRLAARISILVLDERR